MIGVQHRPSQRDSHRLTPSVDRQVFLYQKHSGHALAKLADSSVIVHFMILDADAECRDFPENAIATRNYTSCFKAVRLKTLNE